jgi:hypothetical protein
VASELTFVVAAAELAARGNTSDQLARDLVSKKALRPVNRNDRGRRMDGTYMGPAWTKPPGYSVVRRGKTMSTIKRLLAYRVCIVGLRKRPH